MLWVNYTKPTFAKIVSGELVRLSTVLPPFDEETAGLRDLNTADRVAAGWYQISACPDQNEDGDTAAPTEYLLSGTDAGAGTCTLTKE